MILIKYSNGRTLQGVVLSFGNQLMRVAIKDMDDAVEFRLINGVWVSEDCEIVRIELAMRGKAFDIGDDFLDAFLTAETRTLETLTLETLPFETLTPETTAETTTEPFRVM